MKKDETLLEKGISDLYIILCEEKGIIDRTLERDNKEYYDFNDNVTALECMNDDVSRVWRLVEWHDKLAEIDTSLWKFLESDDPNDLELRFKDSDWLYRLKKLIEIELTLRELDKDTVKTDNNRELLLSFCDYLLECIPSLDYLNKNNAKRLLLIEDFLEIKEG